MGGIHPAGQVYHTRCGRGCKHVVNAYPAGMAGATFKRSPDEVGMELVGAL